MAKLLGPDFISLQVRDLAVARTFYTQVLGLAIDPRFETPEAVVLDEMIAREAKRGRTFIWYTTEIEELQYCDRAYVFRNGAISANLSHNDLTEEKILQASFAESSAA